MRPLLALIVVATACSHPVTSPSHVASAWKGPELLAQVPADTPYLLGFLDPMPTAVRAQLLGQSGTRVRAALQKAAAGDGKGAKAAGVLLHHLEGVDDAHWLEAFGMTDVSRIIVYGMSVWPVARVEIKDASRVQTVVDELVATAGAPVERRPIAGKTALVFASPKVSAVVLVLDHELVAALLPADKVDAMLPVLAGTQHPARSLRDAPLLPALMAKHGYVSMMIAFADFQRGLDAMTGHGKGEYDHLGAMFEGLVTPACQADVGRIVGVMPRLVLGYRKLDARGFTATMAVESPAGVIKAISALHTTMPAMPMKAQPLFAFGAAVNVDAMVAWMKDVTSQLRANPFRCDAFGELNHGIDDLAAKLDQPLPAIARGLRGFELVVDDASMMPPSGSGHLLVAGDHVADLVHLMLQQLPMMAALQVPTTGAPVALPVDQLGIPGIKSAHLAMTGTKAALALGDASAQRASERLAAPDAHAPLMVLSYDLPRLRQQFGMFFKDGDFEGLSNVGSTSLALDVGQDGIYVEMVGTWVHGR